MAYGNKKKKSESKNDDVEIRSINLSEGEAEDSGEEQPKEKFAGFYKFIAKLPLTSHYKIERFTLLLSLCVVLITVNISIIFINYEKDRHKALDGTVLYTANFSSSKTQSGGEIEGVYFNDTNTRCFLVMNLGDCTNLSLNPDEYQIFVCGSNMSGEYKKLKKSPNIQATSYIVNDFNKQIKLCTLFTAPEGFQNDILKVTYRCNSATSNEADSSANANDSSYAQFDQWDIYMNFGGSYYTRGIRPFMNAETISISDMYKQTVVADEEAELRKNLDELSANMRKSIAKMVDLENILTNNKVIIDNRPEGINGDAVSQENNLMTNWVYSNGVMYDWRNGSIAEGYIDKLRNSKSAQQYLEELLAYKQQNEKYNSDDEIKKAIADHKLISTKFLKYKNEKGEEINTSQALTSALDPNSVLVQNISTIQSLKDEYDNYASLKNKYQTGYLIDLLVAEYKCDYAQRSVKVSTNGTQLDIY